MLIEFVRRRVRIELVVLVGIVTLFHSAVLPTFLQFQCHILLLLLVKLAVLLPVVGLVVVLGYLVEMDQVQNPAVE